MHKEWPLEGQEGMHGCQLPPEADGNHCINAQGFPRQDVGANPSVQNSVIKAQKRACTRLDMPTTEG